MRAPDLHRRQLRNLVIVLSLVALSLGCTALLKYRMHYSGSWRYGFLTWNLLLAWVPLGAAVAADVLSRLPHRAGRIAVLPVVGVWLAFLPNAPYLCTDLIHLTPTRYMPFWYDQLMLTAYGVTGVLIGVASMLLMQDVVAKFAGRAVSWLFMGAATVLAAFGIYLGRFERLNSWEVFSSPGLVLRESWAYVSSPMTYSHALEWTLFFSAFLLAIYVCLFGLAEGGSRILAGHLRRPR